MSDNDDFPDGDDDFPDADADLPSDDPASDDDDRFTLDDLDAMPQSSVTLDNDHELPGVPRDVFEKYAPLSLSGARVRSVLCVVV